MDWITQIKNNEEVALTNLYKEYRTPAIKWMGSKYDINKEDAVEIFQQSVLALYTKVIQQKVVHANSSLKSYLYGIIKNKIHEYRRQKTTVPITTEPLSIANTDTNTEHDHSKRITVVKNQLQSMGDPCRRLLNYFYLQQYTIEEISQIMGYKNKDTVKTKKYKCLKRLQSLLTDHKTIGHGTVRI